MHALKFLMVLQNTQRATHCRRRLSGSGQKSWWLIVIKVEARLSVFLAGTRRRAQSAHTSVTSQQPPARASERARLCGSAIHSTSAPAPLTVTDACSQHLKKQFNMLIEKFVFDFSYITFKLIKMCVW